MRQEDVRVREHTWDLWSAESRCMPSQQDGKKTWLRQKLHFLVGNCGLCGVLAPMQTKEMAWSSKLDALYVLGEMLGR